MISGSSTPGGESNPKSLDQQASLVGADPLEIQNLISPNWISQPSKKSGGIRYADPQHPGDQIRIMPGNPADPDPVKKGPYLRISLQGKKSDPIPLKGNPILP